jgi:hypothetical protein
MLKRFGLPTIILGTLLGAEILSPGTALARDHDRERREHEWREHRHRTTSVPIFHCGPSGYYDRSGYWYTYGYYDRWGYFHPYY